MPSIFADGDHDEQSDGRSRREFLLGVGAAVALAGCLGGDDGETTEAPADDTATPGSDGGTTTPGQGGETATLESDGGMATPGQGGETATPESDGGMATPGQGSETATPESDGDGQGLSQSEARDLLPLESLALRYEPPLDGPFGEAWAAVVGETDATAVRVESDSGNYNQVTPQDGTIDGYLGVPVQVDPDGDEITVFAVGEDGARGPVTSDEVPTDDLTTEQAKEAVPPAALSFTYEPPETGDLGSLVVEVTKETSAETLVAQPQEAPSLFADRAGDFGNEGTLEAGTTLDVAVDKSGDEVIVSATVDGATGEVTRWQGPD